MVADGVISVFSASHIDALNSGEIWLSFKLPPNKHLELEDQPSKKKTKTAALHLIMQPRAFLDAGEYQQ